MATKRAPAKGARKKLDSGREYEWAMFAAAALGAVVARGQGGIKDEAADAAAYADEMLAELRERFEP